MSRAGGGGVGGGLIGTSNIHVSGVDGEKKPRKKLHLHPCPVIVSQHTRIRYLAITAFKSTFRHCWLLQYDNYNRFWLFRVPIISYFCAIILYIFFLVTISVLLVPRLTRNAGLFLEDARHTFCECAWNKDAAIKEIINGSYTVPYYSVFQVNKACSSILVIQRFVGQINKLLNYIFKINQ